MSCSFNSNKSNVSSAAAIGTYSNLQRYNSGCGLNFNGAGIAAPANASVRSGFYIVPNYGAISYNALTAKEDSCASSSGYFGIETAYGPNSGQQCNTQYIQSGCGEGGQLGNSRWKCGEGDNVKKCIKADDNKQVDPGNPDVYERRWMGNPAECQKVCFDAPHRKKMI
jgi:hypothetical protein